MKMINKTFRTIILDKYRFYLIILAVLSIVFLLLYLSSNSQITLCFLLLVQITFIIAIVIWVLDTVKMLTFTRQINEKEFRIIDNTVFTENNVYSYSYGKYIVISYDKIKEVIHNDNIFEKVRHPYKGNHGVTIKTGDNDKIIVLRVDNEEKASKISGLIITKNTKVKTYNINKLKDIHLSDLDNWQVKSRF